MKKYFITLMMPFILFCGVVFAEENNLATMLGELKNLQANFVQTVYDNKGKVSQKSKGTMALQRPGKFRWQVTHPMPQLIIANETKLYIYDPDLEQVTIKNLQLNEGDAPGLLLTHDQNFLDQDYEINNINKDDHLKWFKLVPKKKKNMFATIEMGFDNNQIKEMRFKDHLGNTTDVKYSNIKANGNLQASLFNFKPPSGVDIIDETKKH